MPLKLESYMAEDFNWSIQPYAALIKGIIDTQYHEWGFLIYRCVYGDDEAWQHLITLTPTLEP